MFDGKLPLSLDIGGFGEKTIEYGPEGVNEMSRNVINSLIGLLLVLKISATKLTKLHTPTQR